MCQLCSVLGKIGAHELGRRSENAPERFDVTVDLAVTARETENFPVMRELRDVQLTAADMAFVNGGS